MSYSRFQEPPAPPDPAITRRRRRNALLAYQEAESLRKPAAPATLKDEPKLSFSLSDFGRGRDAKLRGKQ